MPTPWPCWTCAHRRGPDTTQTFWCAWPLPPMAYVIVRRLGGTEPHHRYIGTEKQLRGETKNSPIECPVSSNI